MPYKKIKVITDDEVISIAEEYGIRVNPNDVTQYKLCQIIFNLQQEVQELRGEEED